MINTTTAVCKKKNFEFQKVDTVEKNIMNSMRFTCNVKTIIARKINQKGRIANLVLDANDPGAQLGNLERGAQVYICNRKDEIIHGLSPSVKCVAHLLRDMS